MSRRDPRREKLLDYRRNSTLAYHIIRLGPHTRRWACNRRERRLRRELRDHRFDLERLEAGPSRFGHRHSATWDLY